MLRYEDLFLEVTKQMAVGFQIEDDQVSKQKRLQICNFFLQWIDRYFYDFDEDRELMDDFWAFIELKVEVMDGTIFSQRLRSCLKKKIQGWSRGRAHFDELPPEPLLPKSTA